MKLLLCFVIAALAGVAKETPMLRLPEDVQPVRYELQLSIMPAQDTFTGTVAIDVQVKKVGPCNLAELGGPENRLCEG